MGFDIGLTEEDLAALAAGHKVTYTVPGLEQPGYNTTITVEPAQMERRYDNTPPNTGRFTDRELEEYREEKEREKEELADQLREAQGYH